MPQPRRLAAAPQRRTWSGAYDEAARAGWLDEVLTAGARRDRVGGCVLRDRPAELSERPDEPGADDCRVHGEVGADVVARHHAAWAARG